jgi:hypothetical protein
MLVFFLILFGVQRALPFIYRYETSHFSSPNPYRMDKHVLNVVKLFRIKVLRISFTPNATND